MDTRRDLQDFASFIWLRDYKKSDTKEHSRNFAFISARNNEIRHK